MLSLRPKAILKKQNDYSSGIKKNLSLIETFKEFHLRGAPALATRGLDLELDVSKLVEDPKNQE